MNYYTNGEGNLVLYVSSFKEQLEIRELLSENQDKPARSLEADILERLIANSELDWINPADTTGDLGYEEAPILGIHGQTDEQVEHKFGERQCGFWDDKAHFDPIIARWIWTAYAIKDFVGELADHGVVIFTGGYADGRVRPMTLEDQKRDLLIKAMLLENNAARRGYSGTEDREKARLLREQAEKLETRQVKIELPPKGDEKVTRETHCPQP